MEVSCLCFPHTGSALEVLISQLPRTKGHRAHLTCKQTYGHNTMYWYRQDPGQGLHLLFLFVNEALTDKGNVSDRFQAEKPKSGPLHLNISEVEPADSAVYFCASSLATEFQSHILPLQKPPPSANTAPFPVKSTIPLHLCPQTAQEVGREKEEVTFSVNTIRVPTGMRGD
uniref:Ig-like domain-containing protein n=1 Tax=Pelusios castaneus TaxID=367368 RepID=A0A8C8S4Z3_9SAUR